MSMMIGSAIARYQSVSITTSSPGQILVMLYDGLLRFLGEAKTAIGAKDRARAGERIGKALAILEHLITSLDRAHVPELCDNLEALYAFCMHRLLEANLHQDETRVTEVVGLLTPLRDAWSEVVRGAQAGSR